MKLTAENVLEVATKCFFTDEEIAAVEDRNDLNAKKCEGITIAIAWHPQRIKDNEEHILDMLHQLPKGFQKDDPSGGLSFLEACMDKDGHQWGEHRSMELLFVLGIGVDAVQSLMPRVMWSMLPGGMPYYTLTK